MALSKNLKNICFDVLYDYGKTITNQISKSGKEEERLQLTLHRLINVFNLWNLPSCIQRYNNDDIKWKIRIQDVQTPDYITLTLGLQSSAEFERFNAFLRHLIFNWFQDIKVQKLSYGYLSFVVTHPAPVLVHFFPQDDTNLDEHSRFSTSKSSRVESVSEIISLLVKDFGLCILNAPEKLSGNIAKERKAKEMIRSQRPDEYPEFQNDILTTDFHYYRNTPSDVLLKRFKQAYISASNGSQNSQSQFEEHWLAFGQHSGQSSQNQASEVERIKAENAKIKKRIATLSYEFEAQRTLLQLKIDELIDENKKIAAIISEKDAELQETFLELGRTSVELTRVQNEKKRNELFNKTYKSHTASTQTSEVSEWSATTLRARNDQTTSAEINRSEGRNSQDEGHHEQESLNETASLTDISHGGVEGNIYNNYKLLLLRISHDLLKDDVRKLERWVETEFEIDTSGNVNSIFLELDRKKIISTTDLTRLKTFFESILRFDFVCLIESYLEGDYRQLKNSNPSGRLASNNRGLNGQIGLSSQRFRHLASPQWSSRLTTRAYSTGISHGPADQSRDNISGFQRKFQGFSRSNSTEVQVGDTAGVSSSIPRPTQRSDGRNGSDTQKPPPVIFQGISIPSGRGKGAAGNISSSTSQGVVVTDGGRREESEVQASSVRGDQTNASRNTDSGSNGQKLSKPQRPDSSGSTRTQNRGNSPDDDDSQWLCSHYKRRCYVQFECCNKFWPCHRCHNNQSTCGRRKLKSRDTKRVKCVACGQEQEFAQHCSRCNAKFARYFCGLCKHLTGTDDNPYHCEKCGICRIHGDRSFHCDICGVCLDVQLRGNHKCREGSAHDECCICLEDAFTGCQILPCSHKVHKECATQMIRSGITRCPICRESFAHKLERRPNPSKKPPGKQ